MANKVYITNAQSKVKIPSGVRLLIRRCCNAVLENEKFPYPAEISVTMIDNDEIRRLNGEFRKKATETDVLSFPLYKDGDFSGVDPGSQAVAIGDIVVSMEKAFEQAEAYNHTFQREIGFLIVHSMLHLLGYNHEEGGLQEVHTREKEERILRQIGLSRGVNYVADEA